MATARAGRTFDRHAQPHLPRREPVRILVADGNPQLRRHLCDVFSHDRRFVVVRDVALPHDLVAACAERSPDVVILGLDAGPGGRHLFPGSLAALRQALQTVPSVAAIVLVADDASEQFLAPLQAGARGVLLRDAPERTLVDAVTQVTAGNAALDPRLTGSIFSYLESAFDPAVGALPRRPNVDPAVREALSPREREVLAALARGFHNDEIAAQLGVSVGTVKTHLRHIYRKLDVDDRVSAVLTAFQLRPPEAA